MKPQILTMLKSITLLIFSVKGSQILLIIQSQNLRNFVGTIIAFAITWHQLAAQLKIHFFIYRRGVSNKFAFAVITQHRRIVV